MKRARGGERGGGGLKPWGDKWVGVVYDVFFLDLFVDQRRLCAETLGDCDLEEGRDLGGGALEDLRRRLRRQERAEHHLEPSRRTRVRIGRSEPKQRRR